jgi:hypothetical protein
MMQASWVQGMTATQQALTPLLVLVLLLQQK